MLVSKYSASGNDFVIFHAFFGADRSELARKLCHRQNGVGADGLIVLLPHENGVKWEFYNSDGSVADMCANGSRAALLYAVKNELASAQTNLLTNAGVISGSVSGDEVEVELTSPKKLGEIFNESGREWHFYDTGVPHLVSFCDDLAEFDINLARKLRHKFNANVNLAKFDGKNLLVRTYERGVEDETLACGTGMAACFYAGLMAQIFKFSEQKNNASEQKNGANKQEIAIHAVPKSGEILSLKFKNNKIFFKGSVKYCFSADVKI